MGTVKPSAPAHRAEHLRIFIGKKVVYEYFTLFRFKIQSQPPTNSENYLEFEISQGLAKRFESPEGNITKWERHVKTKFGWAVNGLETDNLTSKEFKEMTKIIGSAVLLLS